MSASSAPAASRIANALIHETSPYLLQHATNPVQWYGWNDVALQLAKQQNKPILLSIGYSACHWCHVMAHESFENEEIAVLMNELLINIKVDREERPDLDKIYQLAHQFMTQRSGGWPLTVFLDPHTLQPFVAGTYFPPTPRYNLPAFSEVIKRAAKYYRERYNEVLNYGNAVSDTLQRYDLSLLTTDTNIHLNAEPCQTAIKELRQNFDEHWGGFGRAPKFPHFNQLELLLSTANASENAQKVAAEEVALTTLRKMVLGGIYDQLAGGLARYSVDEMWMIPHFEKMLYDNAPFLWTYSAAWQITKEALFERVIRETAEWVMRDMQAPDGGYYSTLDADSEGKEGKFYVWTREEVRAALTEVEYRLFAYHFGLNMPANFEEEWHLHIYHDRQQVATKYGITLDEVDAQLDAARAKLFAIRQQRIAPSRDEKILTAWNGLMIKGMAVAGMVLQQPRYIDSAQKALDFIQQHLWVEGHLVATYKDKRARLNAYLDDYAFLLDGILTLLQARWRTQDLQFAIALAEVLLTEFADKEHGGFYFTSQNHEQLISRPRPLIDDATPSGNGVAARALLRLGYLLAEPRYLQAAEQTLRSAWQGIQENSSAYSGLLLALTDYLTPPEVVILRGQGERFDAWKTHYSYHANRLCFAIPSDAPDLPESLAAKAARGEIVAYKCVGLQCSAPIEQESER